MSPPVQLVHVGALVDDVLSISNRESLSHARPSRNAPVVVTTAYVPSSEMSTSRMYESNAFAQTASNQVVYHVPNVAGAAPCRSSIAI